MLRTKNLPKEGPGPAKTGATQATSLLSLLSSSSREGPARDERQGRDFDGVAFPPSDHLHCSPGLGVLAIHVPHSYGSL